MMHIDRNGQYSSYWCYSCVRCSFVLSLFIDIDTEMRHWHLTLTLLTHTHIHTYTLNCTSPSSSSLSFFPSFPPSLPPSLPSLSFVRSLLFIRINHSYTHTLDHPSNNQLIDKRSFLSSFVLSFDRWVNTLSSIDRSSRHTHTQHSITTTDCQLCTVLYESERVWCELIAL